MTTFRFGVVVCRFWLFPTLISKINWFGSGLPLKFSIENRPFSRFSDKKMLWPVIWQNWAIFHMTQKVFLGRGFRQWNDINKQHQHLLVLFRHGLHCNLSDKSFHNFVPTFFKFNIWELMSNLDQNSDWAVLVVGLWIKIGSGRPAKAW